MADWIKWQPISKLYDDDTTRKKGVYQIRLVDTRDDPIPVPRLAGTDKEGLYYIGKTTKKLRDRLKVFLPDPESEGEVHEDIAEALRNKPGFRDYRLQYRAKVLEDKSVIEAMEGFHIRQYLEEFCEKPQGNWSLPRKAFDQVLAKIR